MLTASLNINEASSHATTDHFPADGSTFPFPARVKWAQKADEKSSDFFKQCWIFGLWPFSISCQQCNFRVAAMSYVKGPVCKI